MTPDPQPPPPARVRAWAWNGALGVLLVLTSLALASVKAWLVLPYLALMAVILFTPPGRRERGGDHGGESEARSGPGVEGADDRPAAEIEDEDVAEASDDPATVLEPAEGPDPDSDPRGVKTKRGKGRGRKAKAVAESPGATATWIQVGPGKFVRAESPGPPVVAASPTSEGEPSGSFSPSSGTVEDPGPSDAQTPPDRDAEAPSGVEVPSAPEGEPEATAVVAPDETAGDAPAPRHDEGDLGPAAGLDFTVGSPAVFDVALESHQAPVGESLVALAAEDPSSTEGGWGMWAHADAAPVETAAFAPVPEHGEGNLEHGPGPDHAVGSAAAVDAAFASPPSPGDSDDLFASLSGIGEGLTGTIAPGDEPEAVPTAEGSFAAGEAEASDVWDLAAPGDPTPRESAAMQAGGDPEHAWQPDLSAESSGTVELGSYPDAPPPAEVDAEYVAGERESEIADEWARDAGDQALEEIARALVAGEIPDAALGMDATLEQGPDGDLARDNGIAPDAFGLIPPAEPEDASTQDRGEVADAPAAPSDRPNRPTVGPLLASLRGLRPRVGPATATRSRPDGTSPRRVVRARRKTRVSPILRPPSRRGPGRSRPASRTFPPRSPPALAGQS